MMSGGVSLRAGMTSRLRPRVLGDVAVSAEIGEHGFHGVLVQVDAVADGVVPLGKAGLFILEHLGAVEELVAQLLRHIRQGKVELVDGLHGDVGVVPVLVHGRGWS